MRPHANAAAVANRQAPVPQSGPTSSLAWHAQRVDEVLRTFATTTSGLSRGEAALRLDSYGRNELQAFEGTSAWDTFAAQFKNVLILILLAATLLSAVLGHVLEASVIAVIVLLAVLLGFIQEYRASTAVAGLRRCLAIMVRVVLESAERTVPSAEIVARNVVSSNTNETVSGLSA